MSERKFNTVLKKFSFVSTIQKQFDSTVESIISTDENDSDFASKYTKPIDLTLTSDLHFDSMVASLSFVSTDKEQYDSKVELFTSNGRDFDSTGKYNASTGE